MHPDDGPSQGNAQIPALIEEGKSLASQGNRRQARHRFARVLSLCPEHLEGLLWMAALATDPAQSVQYLTRALDVSPDDPTARAGLAWARQQVKSRSPDHATRLALPDDAHTRASPRPSSLPPQGTTHMLDRVLLGGIAIVCLAACIILATMAWGAPEAVRAANRPTVPPASTPTATTTSTPTATATATLLPMMPPTATMPPSAAPTATATRVVPGPPPLVTLLGEKWMRLDLSDQRLTAFEGDTEVFTGLVSTGVARYPTPPGEFRVYLKVRRQAMSGPGYYVPNVEYCTYFFKSYAIHGTYWHDNFGHPMSHGCVNMTNDDAKWIYEWAPKGTRVVVQP